MSDGRPRLAGYTLFEIIGEGAFGRVYRAEQRSTGQAVAVKVLRAQEGHDGVSTERRIARFHREARLCATLNHPHIVHLMDAGQTDDGLPFAVFEQVVGETLRDLLRNRGALPAGEVRELMGQILDALGFAHSQGIVHRDLKPSNIMISGWACRRHAKLLDLGIGGFIPDFQDPDYASLTLSNETLGTPSYAAPEQLRGEAPNPKSDLYSWGLTFLECLTGHAAISGRTVADVLHRQLSPAEVPLPSSLAMHPLGTLLRRTLKKDPAERAGDGAQLWEDLQRLHVDDLVGDLRSPSPGGDGTASETEVIWDQPAGERRPLTVLCYILTALPAGDREPDWDRVESLLRRQQSLCADLAARYGGTLAGRLADHAMLCFGYPRASDTDARLAARASLELVDFIRRQNPQVESDEAVRLELRAGIHSAIGVVQNDGVPSGMPPIVALRLASRAAQNSVLISHDTRELLKSHAEFALDKADVLVEPFGQQSYALGRADGSRASGRVRRRLLGRDRELDLLCEAAAAARQGTGSVWLVRGEPGMGKTRLVEALREKGTAQQLISLEARCLPEYRSSALHPLLELVRAHLHLDETSPESARARVAEALGRCGLAEDPYLMVLCVWLSLPLPPTPVLQHAPQRQKEMAFTAIERLVLGPARMLVMEDLHWADPTSLEFLQRQLAHADQQSLLVMTARSTFTAPWGDHLAQVIPLKPLSDADAHVVVEEMATGLSAEMKSRIVDRAAGVPLFIEELTRYHLEKGYASAAETARISNVPTALTELLGARLDRLGAAAETAALASVIGRQFDAQLLAALSPLSAIELQCQLETLLASDVIAARVDGQPPSFEFRHALVRDAAYARLTPASRRQVHADVVNALETRFLHWLPARPAYVAQHCIGALDYDRAVHYGRLAAQAALARSANQEAIEHVRQIREWLGKRSQPPAPGVELDLNNIATQALMGTRGWADQEVKASIDRSCQLLDQVREPQLVVATFWQLMTYHYVASNRRELRGLTERLMREAEVSEDAGLRVAVQTFWGLVNHGDGRYLEAGDAFRTVRRLYDPERDKQHGERFGLDTKVWSTCTLALVEWFRGDADAAFGHGDEAVRWGKHLGHVPSTCIALLYQSNLLHYAQERERVAPVIDELVALADKFGLAGYQAYGRIMRAWLTNDGPAVAAVCELLANMGCTAALSYYRSLLAEVLAGQGRLAEAIRCVDDCLSLCEQNQEHYYEPELHRLRGEYLLAQGQAQTAAACFRRAMELSVASGMQRTFESAERTWRRSMVASDLTTTEVHPSSPRSECRRWEP